MPGRSLWCERVRQMNEYPEAAAKIADDYLERVKLQLRLVPARERDEFLREIQSHIHEAYHRTPGEQTAGDDDVARMLAVLRNFGEPAEVVSDRLPKAMVRSGTRRSLPLYILAGITIALFGIPLGCGGVGVLVGLLIALLGIIFAFYVVAGELPVGGRSVYVDGPDPDHSAGVVGQIDNARLYPNKRTCRILQSLVSYWSGVFHDRVC